MSKTYIVAFSGGESSALVAIEAVRRHGRENVVLLNHNVSPKVEHPDVKRFKQEVANYLNISITYANMKNWEMMDPVDVCVAAGAWKVGAGSILCTSRIKTEPFYNYLKEHVDHDKDKYVILYGFDPNEPARMSRKVGIMGKDGYHVDFPLSTYERTIHSIEEVGIRRPEQYSVFKHANCIPCLKAKKQHMYLVYCIDPDKIKKIAWGEEEIGYSLLPGIWMDELMDLFDKMKDAGIQPTEHIPFQTFWASAKDVLKGYSEGQMKLFDEEIQIPCDCSF